MKDCLIRKLQKADINRVAERMDEFTGKKEYVMNWESKFER